MFLVQIEKFHNAIYIPLDEHWYTYHHMWHTTHTPLLCGIFNNKKKIICFVIPKRIKEKINYVSLSLIHSLPSLSLFLPPLFHFSPIITCDFLHSFHLSISSHFVDVVVVVSLLQSVHFYVNRCCFSVEGEFFLLLLPLQWVRRDCKRDGIFIWILFTWFLWKRLG